MPIVKRLRRPCIKCQVMFPPVTRHNKTCPKCCGTQYKRPRLALLEVRVSKEELDKFKAKCNELNKTAYELIQELIY